MQMVYAYNKKGDISLAETEKELFHSISKSFELYHLVLLLLTDIHTYAVNRIEKGKNKKIPSPADLNPNKRFVENKAILQLTNNESLLKYVEKSGMSWVNHPEIIKALYEQMVDSEIYTDYMADDATDYDYEKKFAVKLVEKVIAQYEPLYAQFEEQSIFWNDESEFIISMVIKTLKEFREELGSSQVLQPEFKDEEDQEFVKKLVRKAVMSQKEFTQLIKEYAQNWDLERVAYMDIVLMQIALAEVIEFPAIPVKVTLNEYIELAKHYSTPKSGLFINGILDKIVGHLSLEGKVQKTGRGLIDQS
jgi:transcription antitermination protein NusB